MMNKRLIVAVAAGVLLLGSAVAVGAERTASNAAYQKQLRAQVENDNGSPRQGRDPISQSQTSLAAAASQAVGNGLRTDAPAADVHLDHSHHVTAEQVLPAKTTGRSFNGCLIGYPSPGEKCVTKK